MKHFLAGLIVGWLCGLFALGLISYHYVNQLREVESTAYEEAYKCKKSHGLYSKENAHIVQEYDKYRRLHP